ncbi:MAG: hypothetical protein KBG29_13830, partial [Pseudomonadales bacterium]|nr:hypothetical protein [Pseudomonadales bacterium]
VAFATGQQISDALQMTRRVKKVVYEPRKDGTYKVTFYGDGMAHLMSEVADGSRLEQLVGREIAGRIQRGEGQREKGYTEDGWFIADTFGWHNTRSGAEAERQQMIANPTYGWSADGTREWKDDRDIARSRLVLREKDGGWMVQEDVLGHDQLNAPPTALTEVDLTTGGEGNREFYGKIIPKVARDVLRRLGGDGLTTAAIRGQDKVGKAMDDGAGGIVQATVPGDVAMQNVGFDITPALRARAMRGLPMFARREPMVRRSARTPPAKQAQAERARMKRLGQLGSVQAAVKAWFDRHTKVLGGLPEREFYLEQRYLAQGRIGEADKIAAGIRKAFADATPRDKQQLYAFLTTAGAPVTVIEREELRKVAADTKHNIRVVGNALVRAGLMKPETMAANQDAYLPRLYLAHLLDDGDWRAIGAGKKPSDMGYLKKRQDIPEDVRRVILGEIKDPAYLSAMAIVRPMRDIALLGFLEQIAGREGLVLPKSIVEWDGKKVTPLWLKTEAGRLRNQARYMEDRGDAKKAVALADRMDAVADPIMDELNAGDYRDWKKLPDSPRYGRLRGLHVQKDVYEDIVGVYDLMPEDLKWYEPQSIVGYGGVGTRVTQWWKVGKVTLNPGSQVRNVVSNMVMLQLSGVSLHMVVPRIVQAIKEIADDGPHWKIAQRYGVTEASFVSRELPEIKRDAIRLQLETMGEHPLKRMGLLATLLGATVVEKASDVHQAMEYIGKTAKIIDAMAKGATEAQAALEAQDWLFDYSLVPRSVRYLRNQPVAGSPFLTWMYKAAPRLLEVAALHPQRLLPWFGLVLSMPILASMALGGDADDWDEMKRLLPEWARKKGHLQALPFRDSAGRIQFIDLGPYLPWTMWTDFLYNAPSEPAKATMDLLGSIFSWGPVGSAGVAISTGVDPFTDRKIVPEGEPPLRQAAAWASYFWSLAMPPIITSAGTFGKMDQALTGNTNRYGDPRATLGQAAATLFGANVYGINPDTNAAQEMSKLNKAMTDTKIRMLQRLQDRGLSDEKRQEIVKEYADEITRRAQELQAYAERASKVPKELKVDMEPAVP